MTRQTAFPDLNYAVMGTLFEAILWLGFESLVAGLVIILPVLCSTLSKLNKHISRFVRGLWP